MLVIVMLFRLTRCVVALSAVSTAWLFHRARDTSLHLCTAMDRLGLNKQRTERAYIKQEVRGVT